MTDLVKRLRELRIDGYLLGICQEAADRIEALEELEDVALINRNMLLKRNTILTKQNKILDDALEKIWSYSPDPRIIAGEARQTAKEVGDE